MKKAVFISCTNHYTERAMFFEKHFISKGYESVYITSDFNHSTKSHYSLDQPRTIQIPTKPYKSNLSLARIYSHIKFAKDTAKKVGEIKPDLIYVEIPPNSLSRQLAKYKKKNKNVQLVFDIFDMWPETFPNSKLKSLLKLPFGIWGWFRNSGLNSADVVLCECKLFSEKINRYLKNKKSEVLYLCRENGLNKPCVYQVDDNTLNLCYLGSINNIIDIQTISELLKNINAYKKTVLHIIGDGETREQFISSAKETGTEVIFYGKIYDQEKKQEIFDKCAFGLNIMKDSVFIGLTMKSVDYFAGGLPVINSIKGDTWDLVENHSIGINLDRNNVSKTAKKICEMDFKTIEEFKRNTCDEFNRSFTINSFYNKLKDIF